MLKRGPFDPEPAEEAQPEGGEETRVERAILCRFCHHTITRERLGIRVDGRHQHQFMNPHGYLFDIGCFRDAPGCRVLGEPTNEFSWFPGFSWLYAICGACQEHLGWAFEGSDGARFFGLVLNRLVRPEGRPDAAGSGSP